MNVSALLNDPDKTSHADDEDNYKTSYTDDEDDDNED